MKLRHLALVAAIAAAALVASVSPATRPTRSRRTHCVALNEFYGATGPPLAPLSVSGATNTEPAVG